jgi:serine phosphatase RsbU (regulator of sigma subunit)
LQVTTSSAAEIGKFLLAEQAAFRNGRKQKDDISLVIAKLAAGGLSGNQDRSL